MNAKIKKRIYLILIAILAVSFFLQLVTEGIHRSGFYILFGFAGAWILILFSKRILAPLLQKSEHYYGGDQDD